jgi:hypothetical protein
MLDMIYESRVAAGGAARVRRSLTQGASIPVSLGRHVTGMDPGGAARPSRFELMTPWFEAVWNDQ